MRTKLHPRHRLKPMGYSGDILSSDIEEDICPECKSSNTIKYQNYTDNSYKEYIFECRFCGFNANC